MDQEDEYAERRIKADIFENLAFDIYTATGSFKDVHTDERKWLFEELGYLTHETGNISFKLCDRIKDDVEAALDRALTSWGHNRFDYIKMVVGNICAAAKNLA
ncbi:uncharacterized protein J3D65DRAFT_606100 [Phyllosticta citribraziliensis]|uniref:Uncharacterized protein n=1 Tax=Phyllosticta citribraziliensis TaxID=989973 RepID=A0ABR1LA75_9PEZI